MRQIQFMKNLGLIGGFLLLIGSGPGRFSLDAMRRSPGPMAGGQSFERGSTRRPSRKLYQTLSGPHPGTDADILRLALTNLRKVYVVV
jgi:SURF4 family